ncbi:hypothetical protein KIW84_061996 [Lathyrus oleraceus]|uniref:Uncharacterized protein n=1 Tax=Pisum sativum TaxID=3888 RepID=A0A9D4W403_PEA|nr:hypothetical protein KIW84_061996 [Pisum sativum]
MEAVLPVEVQIPSLRIMKEAGLDEDEWIQTRLDQINLIDEKRLAAVCHGQIYQKRMTQAFNKKVKRRVYQIGDLVIKRIILQQSDPRGKWTPTYVGPFVVKKVFSGGAMILATMNGEDFPHPIQPNVRLILQLQYGLAYDPFGPSNPQILPSVRYIPGCSLTYDYFLRQIQPNVRLILQLQYGLAYDPFGPSNP